jgi:hypothetical protein
MDKSQLQMDNPEKSVAKRPYEYMGSTAEPSKLPLLP